MKAVVRPLEGTDLEGFDRLRTLLYPDRPETFDTDRYFSIWRWLGTHPLADQMQRWVVATEEGEVVGHLAALPQYYRIKVSGSSPTRLRITWFFPDMAFMPSP